MFRRLDRVVLLSVAIVLDNIVSPCRSILVSYDFLLGIDVLLLFE